MILIEDIIADPAPLGNRMADYFEIEWYETIKTLFRRSTRNGVEVAIRKKYGRPLHHGDILWEDERSWIQVFIKPCDCIVVKPKSIKEMGIICFEIGNRHMPLSISDDNVISIAYENPLYTWLEKKGYGPAIINQQLLNAHFFTMHSTPSALIP